MQTIKEHTRLTLIETAREAFFKKGFKAVSMREIAAKSGVGLSNIYNYFSNKEGLLSEIMRPLIETMENMLADNNREDSLSVGVFTSEEYIRKYTRQIFSIVSRFRNELELLFYHSQESVFQNYEKEWIERSSIIGMDYMAKMKALYPQLNTEVSPFFMSFVCSCWANLMKEALRHKEFSKKEMEGFIEEYVRFSTGGWKKLMQIENNI